MQRCGFCGFGQNHVAMRAARDNGAALIQQAGSLPSITAIYKIKTSECQTKGILCSHCSIAEKKLLLISLIWFLNRKAIIQFLFSFNYLLDIIIYNFLLDIIQLMNKYRYRLNKSSFGLFKKSTIVFIEIQFTYPKIHHFKVYSLLGFSTYKVVQPLPLILEHFFHPKRKPSTHQQSVYIPSSLQLLSNGVFF